MLRLFSPPPVAGLFLASLVGAMGCAEGSQASPAPPATSPTSTAEPGAAAPADPIGSLLVLPAPDSAEVERALERLEEGLSAWREGDHRWGASEVDGALALLPTAADWRPLIRAELLVPTGDTASVRRALDEVDPDTELKWRWGWELLVQSHEEADDLEGARSAARAAAEARLTSADGAAGWTRAGRLSLELGDTLQARDDFSLALATGPDAEPAQAAARFLDELLDHEEEELRVEVGRALVAGGVWERGVQRLRPALERGGLDQDTETQLRLALGRALVELRRPDEAIRALEPVVDAPSAAADATSALFWIGRAELARSRPDAARESFMELARRAPESRLAEQGMLLVVDHVSSRGAAQRTQAMESLFQVGVGSAAGELVAVRFGTEPYLSGSYSRAAQTFERYLEGGRREAARQQAAYWAALAHGRGGSEERARELLELVYSENPLSFYGSFAAERLDRPVLPADLPAGPLPTPGLQRELSNALIRLRIHQQVPTSGSFAHELERLERHFLARGDAAYDFAEALLYGEFPIQSVVLGREIHRREGSWNLRLLRIVHPFPYREALVREARARNLDPFFVAGLIRQESLFHPSIRSSAGAVGLMQLLPGTAREVARAEGIRFNPASLSDPEINLRLGTAFLASMIRRFDGRAEDALSAYNAGPGRIQQWRQRPEYRDTDVFLEHIPFAETRHYVKVVQQYTRIYTALYGCGDFDPCLGMSYRAAVARSNIAGGAPSSSLAR
jgi:tetratricopeptide (TPR) repeat protein